jgi:hypothetical protein
MQKNYRHRNQINFFQSVNSVKNHFDEEKDDFDFEGRAAGAAGLAG